MQRKGQNVNIEIKTYNMDKYLINMTHILTYDHTDNNFFTYSAEHRIRSDHDSYLGTKVRPTSKYESLRIGEGVVEKG